MTSHVQHELASQPACWRRAADLAAARPRGLPERGERVAVIGCGTSWFMADSYARLREASGAGETDAFAASEMPSGRRYDRVVALSRSGTTTEVLELLRQLRGTGVLTTAITADPATPVMDVADDVVVLDFADERSVVQTRFATTTLTLLRAHLGADVTASIADCERVLVSALPDGLLDCRQFTFLGTGWTVGLASEAALKMREASLSWTESYPAHEYRHGPIAITDARSGVWMLGAAPAGLADQVARAGGLWVEGRRDPLAELVAVQRLAVALAERANLDPDVPRNLTRSVILPAGA